MIKRKLVTSLLTFFISTLIITLFVPIDILLGENNEPRDFFNFFDDFIIYSIYIGAGIFLYGLPLSIVIEKILKKSKEARFFFTFAFHLLLGIIPFFLLWFFTLFSIMISVLFFIVDEILRTINSKSFKK
ncbi:hypothetical protein MKX67_17270 [Cytobacillus sp. FSL W7-1323]|uniref:hypothetical protein n=1 Tax=Cytobacillus TaxID=2675230 RepID=UPI0027892AC0|nr:MULTISPECIES: hypothetical protein [Cytobacillus]MDQ0188188.1 hypothetical protein [Cytobacillus kochii]MEA1855045.1 hypothetical protein [Cytobacillus sp. OWB-43]